MNSLTIFPAMTVVFAITAVFMYALRPLASSIGLIVHPSGRRSQASDVPVIGGVAMFVGVFAGLTLIHGPNAGHFALFVACLALVAISSLDDCFSLPASVRVATQVTAVVIMVYGGGLQLNDIGNPFGTGIISMGGFTLIATVIVAVTTINAYNLVDGVDGLAGSLALIGLSAVVLIGGIGASSTHVALMLAVAIVGFLMFNFPINGKRPLRTFMGDAGSTFLGFAIVWVALSISQESERLVSPVYCLWFAAIPIFDCLTCFVRRSLARKSPLTSARDHFHDALFRGGMGARQVVTVLVGLQLLYTAAAVAAHYSAIPDVAMFATWSVLGLTQRRVIKKVAELYKHRSSQRKHRALAT